MAIRYKIDVLNALKEAGYSTYKLRKEKILGEKHPAGVPPRRNCFMGKH